MKSHPVLSRAFQAVCLTGFASLTVPSAFAQSGGANDLTWNTVDNGGTTVSTGGTFAVSGTIGQPDAVSSSGGDYIVVGGFWPGVECNDGVACTDDADVDGVCVFTPNDAHCVDDGVFCNGFEVCDPVWGCVSSGNPCSTPSNCDEASGNCGCEAPSIATEGPRYLGVTPAVGVGEIALFASGADPDVSCVSGYVQANGTLGASPVFQTPSAWQTAHVRGAGLIGGHTYSVMADCDPANPGAILSPTASSTLWRVGDVDNNNAIDILDIVRIIDAFQAAWLSATACSTDADCAGVPPSFTCDTSAGFCIWVTRENADITANGSCTPDRIIDILDIVVDIDFFAGHPDQCSPACP